MRELQRRRRSAPSSRLTSPVSIAASSVSSGSSSLGELDHRDAAGRGRPARPRLDQRRRRRAGSDRAARGRAARRTGHRERTLLVLPVVLLRQLAAARRARGAGCRWCVRTAGGRRPGSWRRRAPRPTPRRASARAGRRAARAPVGAAASFSQPSGSVSSAVPRTTRRSSTRLAASRRAANSSARSDSASIRCASSTMTTDAVSPARVISSSSSIPTGDVLPGLRARRCWRRPSSAADRPSRTGRAISDSSPLARSTRTAGNWSTNRPTSVVFPIPASPSITSVCGRPSRLPRRQPAAHRARARDRRRPRCKSPTRSLLQQSSGRWSRGGKAPPRLQPALTGSWSTT